MRVIEALEELSPYISSVNNSEKSIGFVPTMGALHEGHLALIQASSTENDLTIVSIFVNPLQFNNQDDLEKYPRVIDRDIQLLSDCSVDMVFIPDTQSFYKTKPQVSINFGNLAEKLEGKYRKGHFEGVGVVICKMFHLIQPTKAYFGLKDLQQFLLIRQMVWDLSFPCDIVGVETVREASGLALSSRNQRLSKDGLVKAAIIYEGLKLIGDGIDLNKPLPTLLVEANELFSKADGFDLEYLEVVDPLNLQSIDNYDDINELAVCVAGYVEGIRLIDNLYLRLK